MTQARKDSNSVNTMLGTLQSDGATPTLVKADPTNHTPLIDDNITGTDNSNYDQAKRDQNMVPVLLAVSETDGVTPVQLYVNADGKLLIDSN